MRDEIERIALIGSEGSGKTCFLAGLRWLSSATEDSPFAISGKDQNSQEYLEKLHQALKGGCRPPPSHSIEDLNLKVSYLKDGFNIHVQDCQGEEFKRAAQSNNVDHPIIRNLLESQFLIVCLDVICDVKSHSTHSDRLDSLFTILHGHQDLFMGKKIAFLLTKADVTGIPKEQWSESTARDYLRSHNLAFAKKIENLQLDVRCYFVASLGSDMQHGESPDPYGYNEVFMWLDRKRTQSAIETFIQEHSRLLFTVVGLLIGAILFLTLRHYWYEEKKATAVSGTATEAKRVGAVTELSDDDKTVAMNEILAEFEDELTKAHSVSSLQNLYGRIVKYKETGLSVEQSARVDDLLTRVADEIENLHFNSLKLSVDNKDKNSFDQVLCLYLADKCSSKRRMDEVTKLVEELGSALLKDEKIKIDALTVDYHISNRDILTSKLKLIESYAEKVKNGGERSEMLQAVKDMRRLLSAGKYAIKFNQGSRLKRNDLGSYLRVKFGNRDNEGEYKVPEDKYATGAEPTWEYSTSIEWKINDKIKAEWKCNKWYWITTFLYASVELDGDCFTLLRFLADKCVLKPEDQNDFEGDPYLKVRCDEFPDADASKAYIEKYIVPGTYWGQQ